MNQSIDQIGKVMETLPFSVSPSLVRFMKPWTCRERFFEKDVHIFSNGKSETFS